MTVVRIGASGVFLTISLEKIEQLAPDQASLTAAKKLLKPAKWPTLEDNGEGLIWGECQGSGATPYRIAVTEADAGYKCTCPSRKFPCKHSLALMWMRADGLAAFSPGTPPQWVNDWLGRRRGPTTAPAKKDGEDDSASQPSIAAVQEEDSKASDPAALARAEAQRKRNQERREALVMEGIASMDQWIADQLERGLAGFDQRASQECAVLAKRLVDAKAGGLANRISAVPSMVFAVAEDHRPDVAARALTAAYLIGQAYSRQDNLPEALKADVRQAVGWTMTREALFEDASLLRVEGNWRVMATRDEVQADRLRRIETWLELVGEDRRSAVLIDFVPVSGGATGNMYLPGEMLDAELVFYPSPVPLRAQIVVHRGTLPASDPWQSEDTPLHAALDGWRAALASKPWLDHYPLCASNVVVRSSGDRLYICADDISLPLAKPSQEAAEPLIQAGEIAVFGLWDGHELLPLLAETPLGEWIAP